MLYLRLNFVLLSGALLASACGTDPAPGEELSDATSPAVTDAATFTVDASTVVDAAPRFDAYVATDAGVIEAGAGDAGAGADATPESDATASSDAASDATATPNDAGGGDASPGACAGNTPHGCWPPKAGNPMGCPAQIHEQSEFYPPLDEWEACSSPYYEPCIYMRPDNTEANCSCDLGLHWLCTY